MRHIATTLPLSLFLALGAPAQETGGPTPEHYVLSLDFPGGSLQQLVEALRGAGKNVNIVVPTIASNVTIPPMVLRRTTVEAALRAAAQVLDSSYEAAIDMNVGTAPNFGPVGEPVYTVQIRESRRARGGQTTVTTTHGEAPRGVRVFSLRALTKPSPGGDQPITDVKTVLTAIDTGLGVAALQEAPDSGVPAEKAVVRLHEDSSLLFVAGTQAQIRIVDEVLSNLMLDAKMTRAAAKPAEAQEAPAAGEGGTTRRRSTDNGGEEAPRNTQRR